MEVKIRWPVALDSWRGLRRDGCGRRLSNSETAKPREFCQAPAYKAFLRSRLVKIGHECFAGSSQFRRNR
jgi:hypothetical protein